MLDLLLTTTQVRMFFLPAYSPELSPCELVFAHVKKHLRERRGKGTFASEIANAFAQISRAEVFGYYEKCVRRYGE